MAKAPPPYKHQIASVKAFLNMPRGIDASDPGTSKTRVAIDLFSIRRKNGGKCGLVVAPKSLLRSVWEDDFRKFAPHIKVSVCPADKRAEGFAADADIYVTNTDAAKWLAAQKPKFFAKFDTLFIDELSNFKHHTSQRSRSMNKVKKHFIYRYGLTGTPNANTIADIWHQVFIIDDGRRLGTSFFHFRRQVCDPEQVGPQPHMLKWVDKPGAEQAVAHLLGDIVVRHKFEECLDIPANHMYDRVYHMTPGQAKAYIAMERSGAALLKQGAITTTNAAGVATKLLQIASGASYTGVAGEDYVPIANERYELVADLVEQRAHTVVFFNWSHQRDELIKEFTARGITYAVIDGTTSDKNRKSAVDMFQAGFYRVLLAQPQSAAHGLTLTKGTATIWASPTYNLELFLQGNRRIYRAGQTQRTETIVIIAAGTIEEAVFARLMDKNKKQLSMLDLLRDYFKDRT